MADMVCRRRRDCLIYCLRGPKTGIFGLVPSLNRHECIPSRRTCIPGPVWGNAHTAPDACRPDVRAYTAPVRASSRRTRIPCCVTWVHTILTYVHTRHHRSSCDCRDLLLRRLGWYRPVHLRGTTLRLPPRGIQRRRRTDFYPIQFPPLQVDSSTSRQDVTSSFLPQKPPLLRFGILPELQRCHASRTGVWGGSEDPTDHRRVGESEPPGEIVSLSCGQAEGQIVGSNCCHKHNAMQRRPPPPTWTT